MIGMVTFVETKLFTKLVQQYLTDDDYGTLQQSLIVNPEAGDVIPETGGVRKYPGRVAGSSPSRRTRTSAALLLKTAIRTCASCGRENWMLKEASLSPARIPFVAQILMSFPPGTPNLSQESQEVRCEPGKNF